MVNDHWESAPGIGPDEGLWTEYPLQNVAIRVISQLRVMGATSLPVDSIGHASEVFSRSLNEHQIEGITEYEAWQLEVAPALRTTKAQPLQQEIGCEIPISGSVESLAAEATVASVTAKVTVGRVAMTARRTPQGSGFVASASGATLAGLGMARNCTRLDDPDETNEEWVEVNFGVDSKAEVSCSAPHCCLDGVNDSALGFDFEIKYGGQGLGPIKGLQVGNDGLSGKANANGVLWLCYEDDGIWGVENLSANHNIKFEVEIK